MENDYFGTNKKVLINKEEYEMAFWLRFICSSRFCELLLGDLENNTVFLKGLLRSKLPSFTILEEVKLSFSDLENAYEVKIYILCNAFVEEMLSDFEVLEAELECIVSQALLQCFWEIYYLD